MKISGFTIARNAVKNDFPLAESIMSIIDMVDEFVVAVGESEDDTEQLVRSIGSPKIKIVNTVWDTKKYNTGGAILAQQTDVALRACTGDWCFYIQADEVFSDNTAAKNMVRGACLKYLDKPDVEGFVLKYVHIYGDYRHYIDSWHFAYPREVRIVRNRPDIHSWRDAQSFRSIPGFDGDYLTKKGTRKLNCVALDALMFHYGWSRDPRLLSGKKNSMNRFYHPDHVDIVEDFHDYGNLSSFPVYSGVQPSSMGRRIENMDWGKYLRYEGPDADIRKVFAPKYRFLRFVENRLLGGRRIGGFSNYRIMGRFSG